MDWEIDLKNRTATHKKLKCLFLFGETKGGVTDGKCLNPEELPSSEFHNAARLAREAGEAYAAAKKNEK